MTEKRQQEFRRAVDIALIHYPVINKGGETIGSAVTNLDLHDIARAAITFGVDNYYVVTPYPDQHSLIQEILEHWQTGHGATYNPARKAALERIKISASLETTLAMVTEQRGRKPLLLTTSARLQENSLSYREARHRIEDGEPVLLLFGTGHGLAPEINEIADYSLLPIESITGYNHLSVRSAVSIILDRLLGVRQEE
ncbi:MAG: hypothetical protein FD168_1691 [Desulfobulbaceae bacterium]|nr:MAG: hypothetical protein FD168_1691 [Desulfobulbaceae bacterium]